MAHWSIKFNLVFFPQIRILLFLKKRKNGLFSNYMARLHVFEFSSFFCAYTCSIVRFIQIKYKWKLHSESIPQDSCSSNVFLFYQFYFLSDKMKCMEGFIQIEQCAFYLHMTTLISIISIFIMVCLPNGCGCLFNHMNFYFCQSKDLKCENCTTCVNIFIWKWLIRVNECEPPQHML